MSDRASKALAEGFLPGEHRTYNAISKRQRVPLSTLYHRARGRRPREEKARSQQYLTPVEEKALEKFLILISNLGKAVRIKFVPLLALSIASQRSTTEKSIKPLGKN
jgi:hypothetical protein